MRGISATAVMLAALTVAFGLGACGSDDNSSAGSETRGTQYVTTSGTRLSADEVEEALAADAQAGRVVDLEGNTPKSISCEKDESPIAWRCRLAPAEGARTVVCVVTVDETTRAITKRSCAPVDN